MHPSAGVWLKWLHACDLCGDWNTLPLLGKFDGANSTNQADLRPKWFRRFERYSITSGLNNKTEKEQVSTFLYLMGDCVDDIIKTLHINEDSSS